MEGSNLNNRIMVTTHLLRKKFIADSLGVFVFCLILASTFINVNTISSSDTPLIQGNDI